MCFCITVTRLYTVEPELTVQQPSPHAPQALLSVSAPHGLLSSGTSPRREFAQVLIIQTLIFIPIQLRDGTVVPENGQKSR